MKDYVICRHDLVYEVLLQSSFSVDWAFLSHLNAMVNFIGSTLSVFLKLWMETSAKAGTAWSYILQMRLIIFWRQHMNPELKKNFEHFFPYRSHYRKNSRSHHLLLHSHKTYRPQQKLSWLFHFQNVSSSWYLVPEEVANLLCWMTGSCPGLSGFCSVLNGRHIGLWHCSATTKWSQFQKI